MAIEIHPLRPQLERLYPSVKYPEEHVSIIIPTIAKSCKLSRTIWSVGQTLDVPAELILQIENQPTAHNRNAGLRAASNKLICFVDDDVVFPTFGWLSSLLAIFESNADIGIIAPRGIHPDGRPQNMSYSVLPMQAVTMLCPGYLMLYDRSRLPLCAFDEHYENNRFEDADFCLQCKSYHNLSPVVYGGVTVLHDNEKKHADLDMVTRNERYYETKWSSLLAQLRS